MSPGDEWGLATPRDHPLRVRRTTLGISQDALAEAAGAVRSTVSAIEDGRTRVPRQALLIAFAAVLKTPVAKLESDIAAWVAAEDARRPRVGVAAQMVLNMLPSELDGRFSSFQAWRQAITPSVRQFAVLVGMNHMPLLQFEANAAPSRGMSMRMSSALQRRLNVSPEYVQALERLPRHDGGSA